MSNYQKKSAWNVFFHLVTYIDKIWNKLAMINSIRKWMLPSILFLSDHWTRTDQNNKWQLKTTLKLVSTYTNTCFLKKKRSKTIKKVTISWCTSFTKETKKMNKHVQLRTAKLKVSSQWRPLLLSLHILSAKRWYIKLSIRVDMTV